MQISVFETADETAIAVAQRVAHAIAGRPKLVIGLPAGRTPVGVYAELRRLHAAGRTDFSKIVTFNLDEFAGISPVDRGSFRTFMADHLFDALRLEPSQVHFLAGDAPDLDAECERYERVIAAAGGIGLQILGVGANGHIGFNEPGDALIAPTHRVRLAESTRRDNAALFGGDIARVPHEALSMGMGTILKAGSILLVATGAAKAQCVNEAVNGPVTTHLPASFLQLHRHVELYLDRAAARGLTRSA